MKRRFKYMFSGFLLSFIFPLVLMGGEKAPMFFDVDEVHSFILFKVSHLGFSNTYGRFTKVSGTIELNEEKIEKSKVSLKISTDSIHTHNQRRDKHLKGPDFFNVKQFPEIIFTSKSLSKMGKKYKLTGVLTLHGQSKEVTGELELMRTGKGPGGKLRTGGEARLLIDRKDFKMKYMAGKNGIGEKVEIIASIEGIQKEIKK